MNEPEELRFKDKIRTSRLSDGGAGRHHLGLPGPAGAAAAAAEVRLDAGAGHAPPRLEGDPGVQLAAGARRRHRHLARADPAPAAHRIPSAAGFKPANPFVRGKAPTLEVDVTDYGYQYAGIRPLDEARRARAHLSLHHAVPPDPPVPDGAAASGSSPATSGCRWMTRHDGLQLGATARRRAAHRRGPARAPARQRPARRRSRRRSARRRNRENNYLLDREVQKTETFTGIDGINTQDRAMQESMGRIVDRSRSTSGRRQGDHPGAPAAARRR